MSNGNGTGISTDYYPELPLDVDPKVSESVRLLYDNVYELRDLLRRGRKEAQVAALSIKPGTAEFNKLRDQLLANVPVSSLNVTNLVGTLAEPQKAKIPIVTTLPDENFAFEGEAISLNGVLFIFDTSASTPGTWVYLAGFGLFSTTVTGNTTIPNPNASTIVVPTGTPFRHVVTQDGGGTHVVSWATEFKGISDLTVGRTANRVSVLQFHALSETQFLLMGERGDISV